jgi:type III restriction enzyme
MADAVYLVETRAQAQVIHPNVQRKLKAALAWCDRINGLTVEQRGSAPWYFVLLAENVVHEWQVKSARLADASLQSSLAF